MNSVHDNSAPVAAGGTVTKAPKSDLIARLEGLCGDENLLRTINADIASAVGWSPGPAWSRYGDAANWRIDGHVETMRFPPNYTESIDTALLLLPEWHRWKMGCGRYVQYIAEVQGTKRPHEGWYVGECDSSPAIALCIAALKARAGSQVTAQDENQTPVSREPNGVK